MLATFDTAHIRLLSKPYTCRRGLIPMTLGLCLGWLFVLLWLVIARIIWASSPSWALLWIGSALAFAICLGCFTYSLIRDAFKDYVLELSDTDAVLTVEDKLNRSRLTQMVLLNDIKYAEYYPYTDSACLIFHAPYVDMEVPLWPMESCGEDILDFLAGRGVKVVNVQTDDQIPD